MALYRDTGVVLRTYKLGEADRIVVVFTKGRGKVRAVAKGVRKTRSKFGSRLEPLSQVDLQLYETRGELDIVTGAETVEVRRRIRDDFNRVSRAVALLEAVDELTIEGEMNLRLFNMLTGALGALEENGHPLVVPAFLLKALTQEGLGPEFDKCIECDAVDDLVAFDPGAGGVLCEGCRRAMPLSPEALALARQVLGGRLGQALASPPGPEVLELEQLASKLFEYQVERRLRAMSMLPDRTR